MSLNVPGFKTFVDETFDDLVIKGTLLLLPTSSLIVQGDFIVPPGGSAVFTDTAFQIVDATDPTIRILFNAAGTTGTSTTITTSQTANRIFTLPDITGTAIVDAGVQTLTGAKTFTATTTTFTGNVTVDRTAGNHLLFTLDRNSIAENNQLIFSTNGVTDWSLSVTANSQLIIQNSPATSTLPINLSAQTVRIQAPNGLLEQNTPTVFPVTGVLSSGHIRNGLITSTTAAAVVATTDTAAAIVAGFPLCTTGDTKTVMIVNTGPNTFTIAAGAGVTLNMGNPVIATLTSRIVRFFIANHNLGAEAVTVYG
jgi:hypothetical protein